MTKLYTDIKLLKKEPIFEVFYTWESPDRQWKEKDKLWFASYSLFFVALIAISAILGYYLLIVTILAFGFLWFLQASVPPQIVEHKITTNGIKTLNTLIRWREIKYYWFSKKEDNILLNIDYIKENTKNPGNEFIRRVSIIVDDKYIEIFNILSNYCDYGDKTEIGYNFLTGLIYGKLIDEQEVSNSIKNNLSSTNTDNTKSSEK